MKLSSAVLGAALLAVTGVVTPASHAQRVQTGPIEVIGGKAEMREFSNRIEALGTLEPRERVDLTASASDRVTAVFFDDGQRVRKGATLLTMASEEESAQLAAAEATLAEARRQQGRAGNLLAEGAVSRAEVERLQRDEKSALGQVRALQARMRDRVVVAPFDGVLGFRRVSPGAYLSSGQVAATLIDDSTMRLEFSVPSVFIGELREGLDISARTDDIPGTTFTGQVTSLDNSIDPVTRSVRVRATLPNPQRLLRAGMFMTVDLKARPRTSLSIPEMAIIAEGPSTFVFVAAQKEGKLRAEKRPIKVGLRQRGVVEVVEGLTAGETIVADGILKVRPGAEIRIRPTASLAPTPRPSKGQGARPGAASGGAAVASTDRASLNR